MRVIFLFVLLIQLQPVFSQNSLPGFEYDNFLGGKTNLSDFEGKVVYLEIWASWCHFCRQEAPFLKKLKRLFKNDNVVFINVAIDDKEESWRNYIAKKKIGGVNLITYKGFESDIIKHFEVTGIPYFILVDKTGKIVELNITRPSDPLIIEKINTLLL